MGLGPLFPAAATIMMFLSHRYRMYFRNSSQSLGSIPSSDSISMDMLRILMGYFLTRSDIHINP